MRLIVLAMVVLPRLAHADCHPVADDVKIHPSFKPETSLAELATWITGITCKNVVFDSALATRTIKVSILASNEMTAKQALQLFVDSLDAVGLSASASADSYVVKVKDGCGSGLAVSLPPDPVLDKLVHKLDDTHVELNLAAAGIKQAELINMISRGARIVPSMKDGKPYGVKLYTIRPSSLFGRLGFQNGDTVLAINGFALNSPETALEAYSKLRAATALAIDVVRRGNAVQLVVTIK
jgi:general secretion pathway protein C